MAACLLLTVSTGIDFAKAEEVYRGVFQGYSAALTDEDGTSAEKQLYDATNTYEYKEYAGHDYTADYVTENGVKVFKDWYDMSTGTGNPIASGAPGITVFTHGLGATASHWSNNGAGKFAPDVQSPVEQLNNAVKLATGEYADKYWVHFSDLNTFYLVPLKGENIKTDGTYMEFSEQNTELPQTVEKLEDVSNHIILIFEAVNPKYSNNYIYRQFNYALSKIAYDYLELSGALPRFNLIGHSRGGLTNLQYALDHPDMVASLFSFDTPYLGSHSAKTSLADSFMGGPGLVA